MNSPYRIDGAMPPAYREILTPKACQLLAKLERHFGSERRRLLKRRVEQHRLWTVPSAQTEPYTHPVDRKMMINALNAGAGAFMACFEDSAAPTWENCLDGQINLRDAARGTIAYDHPTKNKTYRLRQKTATLFVRPRGWHLEENHFLVGGRPMSATLFDLGLYLYHNAHILLHNGSSPCICVPKFENEQEAQLWAAVFNMMQREINLPAGSINAMLSAPNRANSSATHMRPPRMLPLPTRSQSLTAAYSATH